MKRAFLLFPVAVFLIVVVSGCPTKKPGRGYQPALTSDPYKAQTENWDKAQLFSGAYSARFTYSNGKKIRLRADMVIQPVLQSVYDLSYNANAVAIVTITPDFINLLNHREKYYVRAATTVENAEKLVGIYLPSQEVACMLSGRGFDPERFENIFPGDAEGGGIVLSMYHKIESLRAEAHIDEFGRLLTIIFFEAGENNPFIRAKYNGFRHDEKHDLIWPTVLDIELLDRNEKIHLKAIDVDINSERQMERLNSIFARRVRGNKIDLDKVPPGPPLLYRNLKVYAEDEK